MNLLGAVLKLIRPLFVKDIDPNEEFLCVMCLKPVLRRVIVCSPKCYAAYADRDSGYAYKDSEYAEKE